MKKIVLIFMIIILLGSLVACGRSSGDAKNKTSEDYTAKNIQDTKKSDATKKSKTNNMPESTTDETTDEEITDDEEDDLEEIDWNWEDDENTYSNSQDVYSSEPESTPEPIPEPAGWIEGIAGAYGGSTDPGCGSWTATGEPLDDLSMGVAIPMSWPDYYTYFGRTVEIKYGETIVLARVNDCGYMGGGSMSLDLQPGVFRTFGFESCNAWGVRQVSYRFR